MGGRFVTAGLAPDSCWTTPCGSTRTLIVLFTVAACATLVFAQAAADEPRPSNREQNHNVGRLVVILWSTLAVVGVLVLTTGGIWLIRRLGQPLRRQSSSRPRIVYHDMSLKVVSDDANNDLDSSDDNTNKPKID